MKKFFIITFLAILSACASTENTMPDYNHLAAHMHVIGKTSKYVVYEYSDVRVDEIAPVAALYCNDQDGKTAELYDIALRPDHRRRATFICK